LLLLLHDVSQVVSTGATQDWSDRNCCSNKLYSCDKHFYFCSVVEVAVNLRPTVSRSVCLDIRRPFGTSDQFFFLLEISFRQLRVFYFVAPSLTRGWVCNLL
jgi:hypothetical protein